MLLDPDAVIFRPSTAAPAPAPFSSTIGASVHPGCFWALITIGVLIVGSAEVGEMVATPAEK